jgi:uncharacterized protein (DUF983 family)
MDNHQFESNRPLAILKCKCPQCQSGNMFESAHFSRNFMQMHSECPHCKLRFEIEPGFFWGSMYISYAITVGLMLVLGGAVYFLGNNPDSWVYLTVIISAFVIISPLTYRYSRVLMIYLFSPIRFNKELANRN